MDTHDLGRLYWHIHERKDTSSLVWPMAVARSEMLEPPYRRGLGLGFFLPKSTKGIVLGWWGHKGGVVGIRVIGDRTKKIRFWQRPASPTVETHFAEHRANTIPKELLDEISRLVKQQQQIDRPRRV